VATLETDRQLSQVPGPYSSLMFVSFHCRYQTKGLYLYVDRAGIERKDDFAMPNDRGTARRASLCIET
jgi:hypothetical protein